MSWSVCLCATLACLSLAASTATSAGAAPYAQSVSLAPPPAAASSEAAVEVTSAPDPILLLTDRNPVLAANKRLVFDMWRSIVNAGHVDVADDLLLENYIQHSPVLPTGRAAFKSIFSALQRRDIPELVSPPLITIIAERDLVVMGLREELPEPGGKGSYTTTHFNLFRVENGRLAEHWHSVQTPPGADVPPADKGGPQPVTGASGAAQLDLLQAADPKLAANKRLVFDAWRQMLDAGREAFISATAARADAPLAPAIQVPLVAMVAQGDLVVVVTGREHPHPSRAGSTYTTTEFDMFRIENNRLAEHWSGAIKPGTIPAPYTN